MERERDGPCARHAAIQPLQEDRALRTHPGKHMTPPPGDKRDWDKEMAKIDKQLESISDAQLFPDKKTATPAQPGKPAAPASAHVAEQRATTASWPAIVRLTLSMILGVG